VGGCQCNDHKYDPIAQREYYRLFAFFNSCDEPTLELASPEEVKKKKDVQARLTAAEKRLARLDRTTEEVLAKWEGGLSPEAKASLPAEVRAILATAPNGRSPQQEAAVAAAYRTADQTRHVAAALAGGPLGAAANVQLLTQRQALVAQVADLKKQMPNVATTLVVQERKTPRTTN